MASRLPYRVALTAAVATGALARLWNLRDQVAIDDELHAVRAALARPVGELWRTYQKNDNCLPLSVLDRLWIDTGQPLTELVLRAPVVLCGLALLWWLPRVVGRRLGEGPALVLAWLLALSPLLVLYSRIARSYAPITLFGSLAAVAFLRWWLCGNRAAAALYVLFAALTVYFHLIAAPFVLAPWLFAAGDLCVRPRTSARPKWRQILVVGAATAGGLGAFLLPASDSLATLFETKSGEGALTTATFTGLLRLWAGTRHLSLVVLFWTAALAGLVLLWIRQRRLAVFSLVLVASQVLALTLASPFLIGLPIVLSRYLIVALPVVLVWVAVALAEPWQRWPTRGARLATSAVCGLFGLVLLLSGPLADPALRRSVFAHANDYLEFSRGYPKLADEQIPAFYRNLPAPGPIVEAPWPTSAKYGRSLLIDERRHGQRVLVLPYDESLVDPRLAFRNALQRAEDALDSPARWFVLHLDLEAEEEPLAKSNLLRGRYPVRAMVGSDLQRRSAAETRTRLEAQWGAPDVVEERIVVWDLERVRAATIAR